MARRLLEWQLVFRQWRVGVEVRRGAMLDSKTRRIWVAIILDTREGPQVGLTTPYGPSKYEVASLPPCHLCRIHLF